MSGTLLPAGVPHGLRWAWNPVGTVFRQASPPRIPHGACTSLQACVLHRIPRPDYSRGGGWPRAKQDSIVAQCMNPRPLTDLYIADPSGAPSGFTLTAQATYELIRSCIRYPSVTVSKTYSGTSGEVRTTYTRVDAPAIAVIWRSGDFVNSTTVPVVDSTTIAVATVVPIVVIAMVILGFILYRRRARPSLASPSPAPSLPAIGGNDTIQTSGTQGLPAPIELQEGWSRVV